MKRVVVFLFSTLLVSCGGVEQPSNEAVVDTPNTPPTASLSTSTEITSSTVCFGEVDV